jgi:hypothetical protein
MRENNFPQIWVPGPENRDLPPPGFPGGTLQRYQWGSLSLMLFDFQAQKWSELAKVRAAFLNWSKDVWRPAGCEQANSSSVFSLGMGLTNPPRFGVAFSRFYLGLQQHFQTKLRFNQV